MCIRDRTHSIPVETKLEETEEEVLVLVIGELRNTFNSMAKEIIVPVSYTHLDVYKRQPLQCRLDKSLSALDSYQ